MNLRFILHKKDPDNPKDLIWNITHAATGAMMAHGDTKKQAIEKATARLKSQPHKVAQRIAILMSNGFLLPINDLKFANQQAKPSARLNGQKKNIKANNNKRNFTNK